MKKYIGLTIAVILFLTSCSKGILPEETTTYPSSYFTNANGELVPAFENVPASNLNASWFAYDDNGRMSYRDESVQTKTGIDVSMFQGEIDWQAVANDGIDFVMLRIGCRGYGPSGFLLNDDNFDANYQGALNAGLDIGVYYFSQAITPQEAEEEADYVINKLSGLSVSYPIAYDWEMIDYDTARTDNMTGEEITACALAFCNKIKNAGYETIIYFNCELGYFNYQLEQLNNIRFWLAEYADTPSFYYDYTIWQYTKTGKVNGIEGDVDINISLYDYAKKTVG